MENNKVELSDGTVLIDLTSDTVDAEHLLQGYTAHDKSGASIVGMATGGGGDYDVESVDNGDGTQTLVITDDTGGGSDPVIEPLSVTENGTYTVPTGVDGFNPVIVNVSTGTPGEVESGVIFIDYNGTIVEAWNVSDVAGKTALPTNPSHNGLVAQGWNWTLANIKSYISNYSSSIVYVGQMYETVSGLTEIDITVTKVTGLTVNCNMVGNKDWGDGTTDALTEHTYVNYGDYTITCDGTSIPGSTSSRGGLFGSTSSNMNQYWCTAIRIGGTVTKIEGSAFYYCSSLTNIIIPDGVTSIGNYAFTNCYSLTSITIPNSVTIISNCVLQNCNSLTSISISDSVTKINGDAFYYCCSLTSIAIPSSVTSIGGNAFYYCYSLARVTIPNGVITIGASAFNYCYSLSSITIPNSVTSIGSNMFVNCYSLSSITIPNGVTSIGSSAFYYCYSLTSITIPNSVTSIGDYAFTNCYSLIEYDFTSKTSIPSLTSTNAFTNVNGICKIIVPDTLYDSWIAATNWSTYADYIYKASEVFDI